MLSGSSYSLPLWDISFHPKTSSELCWIPALAWLVQTNTAFSCLHFLPETTVLLLRHPLTNKQCVSVQKCPWWQVIHYTWMNEINSLCLFPTTLTLWEKEVPNPTYRPLPEQHDGISAFSPPAGPPPPESLSLDISYGKDLNALGMCFLCCLQVKI